MLCSDSDEETERGGGLVMGVGEGRQERESTREKSASEPKRGKGKQMKSDTLIQRASSA